MNKIKKWFSVLGPGFITGASDDDPSGIATYAQTGALFGYSQLWTALFSTPFMIVIQEMCGRIGMVSGRGLAVIIRDYYSKKVLYFAVSLLLVANMVNIGADLGAMAASAQLLIGMPFVLWLVLITALTIFLEIVVSYPTYAQFLKYLTLSLFAYLITAFVVKQNWNQIALSTLIPTISFDKEYIFNIIAILGTTISPYLFFWQADEEIEEEIEHHKLKAMGKGIPRVYKRDIRDMRIDTIAGMFLSNIVMFFIIIVSASAFHMHNITNIQTADQAAQALKPFAGDFAELLFAAGVIGTGMLAVPVLAGSASYAVAEALNWKAGLNLKFKNAHNFYIVIAIATLVGLLVNFTQIKPFQLLYYTAMLNGLCAPPLIVLILIIGNNPKIMGQHVNGLWSNIFGWVIAGIMAIAGIALVYSVFIK